MEQYLAIIKLSNQGTEITDATQIMNASTLASGKTGDWWYTCFQGAAAPKTCTGLNKMVTAEFVPPDHVRRSRDRIRKLELWKVSGVTGFPYPTRDKWVRPGSV